MSPLFSLALHSLRNRRGTALLILFTLSLSVMLLLGVERLRQDARTAFLRSVEGIDLVVGARAHPVQLMLYSVFRLGEATQNISWDTYTAVAERPEVAWAIPISLGDSHQGYRVVGTTTDYFTHLQHQGEPLAWQAGGPFVGLYDAVIGADVARSLGYTLGSPMVLAHGTARNNPQQHDDQPFQVSGILAPTGTPIDQGVYVSLPAIEAIHLNWRGGTRVGRAPTLDGADDPRLQPRSITAFYLGLDQRLQVFALQRWLQTQSQEPLTAVLPGVAVQQLWSLLSGVERALLVTTACLALSSLLGLAAVLLASLEARRREMAILRAMGARPWHLAGLLLAEAWLLVLGALVLGNVLLQAAAWGLAPWLQARFGVWLTPGWPSAGEWQLMGLVLVCTTVVALLPGWSAYRRALADGLQVRA